MIQLRWPSTRRPSRLGNRLRAAKNSGIVKILVEGESTHAGMGILVSSRFVITCAHVVNAALGHDPRRIEAPDETARLSITFPLLADDHVMRARVCRWRAAGPSPRDDIALLVLEADAPATVGIAILADITRMPLDADRLSVFGLAADRWVGNNVDARFMGSTTAAWIQIDAVHQTDAFIEPGYSGAAVWDAVHDAVVGMIVAKRTSETEKIAYMIPAADLAEFLPEIPIERRGLTASFAAVWTILAAITFLLILSHWAVDRGITAFRYLSIGDAHKQLSAFWGMHVVAFFMPVLMAMLLSFASAFRQQKWWRRVPSFGRLTAPPLGSRRRLTAALSLVAFVVLPLAAQAHFILRFHKEGFVYVYPSSFGYSAFELIDKHWTCDVRTVHLCTHPAETGRYTLLAPKPGHPGAFWDNAYHYGDRIVPNGASVTYFPVLQPIILYILTALAAGLAGLAAFRIFRPTADPTADGEIAR